MGVETLGVLFVAAAAAGFVDTVAGGGGLITLPVLLLAQVPPLHALATNKLQGSFGTLTSSLAMLHRRLVRWHQARGLFIASLVGAALGTLAVQQVHAEALDMIIPVVLVGIGLYFLLAPGAGDVDRNPRLGEGFYRGVVVPVIGFYDGFFGPGTGSFFSLAGVSLRGHSLVTATAHAKLLNFASNAASLAVFVIAGKVVWLAGAAMIGGQIIGAWFGSHAVVRGGARLIRPLIVVMCLAMMLRYAWQKGVLG